MHIHCSILHKPLKHEPPKQVDLLLGYDLCGSRSAAVKALTLDVECCVHDMDGGGSPSAEQLRVNMSPEFPLMELFQLVISGGTKY